MSQYNILHNRNVNRICVLKSVIGLSILIHKK
jgi:hypothetical protein